MERALVTGIKSGLLCSSTSERTEEVFAKADKIIDDAVRSAYLSSDEEETSINVQTEKKNKRVVWKDLESHPTAPFAQTVPAMADDASVQNIRSAAETADLIDTIPQIVIHQPDEAPGPAALEGEYLNGPPESDDLSTTLPPMDETSMWASEAFGTFEQATQLSSAAPLDDGSEASSSQLEPISESEQSTRPKRNKKQQLVKDICTILSAKIIEQCMVQSNETTRPIEQQREPIVRYPFRSISAEELLGVNIPNRRGEKLGDFLKEIAKRPHASKPAPERIEEARAQPPQNTEILHRLLVPEHPARSEKFTTRLTSL